MTHLSGPARAAYLRAMFARIAGRYDLMNRLMTGGQDVRWRRMAVGLAGLPRGGRLLDLGTGTGELAAEALRAEPAAVVVGGDFTMEMMRSGRAIPARSAVRFAGCDALDLPFPAEAFDAVTSGYLLRNVTDVTRALAEQWRVLKRGGRVVCLDTTPPGPGPLRPLIDFHLHVVIPTLGRVVAGESDAYTYLPDSTESFLPAEGLAAKMAEVGFRDVKFRRMMFGTMALHWGTK